MSPESQMNQSKHSRTLETSNYNTKSFKSLNRNREDDDVEGSLLYLVRNCFKDMLAIEVNLEEAKRDLALRPDFTLAGAFNFFTGYSQSRLAADDLKIGFERLGIVCSVDEVQMYIERYDSDRDKKLGFWEFSNSLLPVETLVRDDLERRRAQFELSYETKELLRRTFRKLLDAESIVENLRQRIAREKAVSLRKAFDGMDWLGRGFLTNNEFKRVIEQIGQRVSSFH